MCEMNTFVKMLVNVALVFMDQSYLDLKHMFTDVSHGDVVCR